MRKLVGPALIVLALGSSGCTATNSPAALDDSPAAANAIAQPTVASGAAVVTPVSAGDLTTYRLEPFDTVEVSVFEVQDLKRTAQITANGTVDLPLIGTVKAAGKTVDQFKRDVGSAYGSRYVNNPTVMVTVTDYGSQKVTVEGSVTVPGVYSVPGGGSLLQVIAMAKGTDRVADTKSVMVYPSGNDRAANRYDVDQIRAGKAPDPRLRGGDVVVVPESAAKTAWRDVRESVGVVSTVGRIAF